MIGLGRELLAVLARHRDVGEFSRTWLHYQVRGRHHLAAAKALEAPLALLERHGYVRRLLTPFAFGPGRRPSDRFAINPLWERNETNPPSL